MKKEIALFLIGLALGVGLTYGFLPRIYELTIQQTAGGADEIANPSNVEAISIVNRVQYTLLTHNTWTAIGKKFHRNFLWFHNITGTNNNNNATYGFIGWVSLGNATVAEALTKLTSEATTAGASRKAFDTVVAYDNVTYTGRMANATVTFSFTATIRIDAVGFHWKADSNTDNNMYSAFQLSAATTFNNGDTLIIKYYHRSDGT